MYGTEEDRKEVDEALEEAKKSPLNIMIDNNPDEIELRRYYIEDYYNLIIYYTIPINLKALI